MKIDVISIKKIKLKKETKMKINVILMKKKIQEKIL